MTEVCGVDRAIENSLYIYIERECFYRCCCCSVCRYTAVPAAAAMLLLPATVCYPLPHGQICCCWFIVSDPIVFFLFINFCFYFMVPLGNSVSHLSPRFPCCNTSSVIMGMRGTKAGVSPRRRSPPLHISFIQIQVYIYPDRTARKDSKTCA